MSDKKRAELWEVDRLLREMHPVVGMCSTHVQVTIEKVCGFELFNTRAYHNYETWSDGYRVSAGERSGIMDVRHNRPGTKLLVVEREDLDDALREYVEAAKLFAEWKAAQEAALEEDDAEVHRDAPPPAELLERDEEPEEPEDL